ncbi:MAG: MFS transporter [Chloroflexi bacterium]|nr:MFS transporter [Chloroflexota bacterium]
MKLMISRQMMVVMSVLALGVFAMATLSPMMPLYLSSVGVSPQIMGLMLSTAMVGMIIGVISWGLVADKIGAKLPLSVGTFLAGLVVFTFLLTQNVAFTFIIFLFWGLVRSALFSPSRGYIGANAPALKKSTFMAIIAMEMAASQTIGALPGGFLVDHLGFQAVFFVSGGISLLAGITVLFGFRQAHRLKANTITDEVPPLGNLPTSGQKINYRLFATQCLITILQGWGRGTMTAFLPLLATRVLGLSATKVGVLFTISTIPAILMSVPMGMLADRIGKKALMIFGLVISAAALAGIAFSPSYSWLIVSVFAIGVSGAAFNPAALGTISDLAPRNQQSTAMGFYGAFGENIGVVAGQSLGGFIWGAWGPQSAFLTGSVTSTLGLLICLLLLKVR